MNTMTQTITITCGCGETRWSGYGQRRKATRTPDAACEHCHGTDRVPVTAEQYASIHLYAHGNTLYQVRSLAPQLVERARQFAVHNPWCGLPEAISTILTSDGTYFPVATVRERRAAARKEAGASWRGLHMGIIAARDVLYRRMLKGKTGTDDLGVIAAARYRAGNFGDERSALLRSMMTSRDLAVMQMGIGMHANIGGVDSPYFPRLTE